GPRLRQVQSSPLPDPLLSSLRRGGFLLPLRSPAACRRNCRGLSSSPEDRRAAVPAPGVSDAQSHRGATATLFEDSRLPPLRSWSGLPDVASILRFVAQTTGSRCHW